MEAHAIRESVHIANRRLNLILPSWIDNQDVEVIILPKSTMQNRTNGSKSRVPNLFAGRGAFNVGEDFDAELPESFWMGDDE